MSAITQREYEANIASRSYMHYGSIDGGPDVLEAGYGCGIMIMNPEAASLSCTIRPKSIEAHIFQITADSIFPTQLSLHRHHLTQSTEIFFE
jgi:hypothetical protein